MSQVTGAELLVASLQKQGVDTVFMLMGGPMESTINTLSKKGFRLVDTRHEQGAAFMRGAGVDIVALNCGTAVDVGWAARAVKLYQQVCDLPTMAQPNAGQPVLEHMKVVYKQTAEDMVAELPTLLETGVNIVGGCCGSTPDHIRAFRKIIDERGNSR